MVRRSASFRFVAAGLAGGAVFLAVELLLLPVWNHVRADWFLRLVASLMAGPVTLTASRSLELSLVVTALGMHAALSLLFGLAFCWLIDRLSLGSAIGVSVLLGLSLYVFDFYVMTLPLPWFATARGAATLLAHLLFGVTVAAVHKSLVPAGTIPDETGESPVAARHV